MKRNFCTLCPSAVFKGKATGNGSAICPLWHHKGTMTPLRVLLSWFDQVHFVIACRVSSPDSVITHKEKNERKKIQSRSEPVCVERNLVKSVATQGRVSETLWNVPSSQRGRKTTDSNTDVKSGGLFVYYFHSCDSNCIWKAQHEHSDVFNVSSETRARRLTLC